jgi:hypothetical protein
MEIIRVKVEAFGALFPGNRALPSPIRLHRCALHRCINSFPMSLLVRARHVEKLVPTTRFRTKSLDTCPMRPTQALLSCVPGPRCSTGLVFRHSEPGRKLVHANHVKIRNGLTGAGYAIRNASTQAYVEIVAVNRRLVRVMYLIWSESIIPVAAGTDRHAVPICYQNKTYCLDQGRIDCMRWLG